MSIHPSFLPSSRVAVFVDGDNVDAKSSEEITEYCASLGPVFQKAVYARDPEKRGWFQCPGFRVVQCRAGPKATTDMVLALDAFESAMRGEINTVVLASADADFTPLA